MPPPTRSHLRIYTSNSSNPNNPSSIIFPIHPPGPSVTSYAIRHNVASDSENVGLVVGRIYTDANLPTLERAEAELGAAGGETCDENTGDKNAMDEIWRLRKKEQEELDLLSPALLLFHVYPTGSTFLEVPSQAIINPRTMVSLTRLTTGHTKPPLNRSAIIIPHSTPSHHILVFLDCDSQISVKAGLHTHKLLYQTVEMSIAVPSTSENNNGQEIYSTGREFIGDEGTSEGSVKSVKSGEDVEGGLGTPPRDKVVTRVLDTPHRHALQGVMSQTQHSIFSNFDPTPDSGLASTARRLFPASEEVNKKEAETLAIDDDDFTNDEDIIPTIPTTLPTNTGPVSIRVINTLSPSPSNRPNFSNPPSISNLPITNPDSILVAGTDASHSESEDMTEKIKDKEPSDSLPEAFKAVQEAKRLRYSPPGVKTYGHRKAKAGNTMSSKTNEDQHEDDGNVESLGENRLTGTQESALSSVQSSSPVRKALQGNSKVKNVKRKTRKREEKEIAESSQPEPKQAENTRESMELDQKIGREEEEEKEEEEENEDKANHVFAPTGKRPRLKRKSKYVVEILPVSKAQEEIAGSFDTEETQQEQEEYGEEASQTIENVAEGSKGVKRKATGRKEEGTEKKKENRKPPKKKAKVAKGDEKEDKGNNTQYTFVASQDSESENDEVEHTPVPARPPIKTPAKRSRKTLVAATPAKTPHTAISALTPSLHGGPRTLEPYFGSSPKVVFSNSSLPNRKDHNNILRALGVKKAQNVADAGVTHLVVGEGGLVRSSKLALALTLGLPIVTDSWLLDSYHNPGSSASGSPTLLDSTPYIPSDPHNESAWQFSLPEAISRGKSGQLSTLLSTCSTVYLTPALLGHLKSTNQETGFMDILKATGAKKILKRAPKGSMEMELGNSHGGLVFGAGDGEKEVDLVKWEGGGWRVYKTEMLTMSILRGNLEVGAEFKLSPGDGVDKSQISEKGGEVPPAKSGKSGGAGGGRRKSGKF